MNFFEASAKAKGFDKILDQQYTTTTVRVSSTILTTYHLEEKNGRLKKLWWSTASKQSYTFQIGHILRIKQLIIAFLFRSGALSKFLTMNDIFLR